MALNLCIHLENSYLLNLITAKGFSSQEGWGIVETGGIEHGVDILDKMQYSVNGEPWEVIPTTLPGMN